MAQHKATEVAHFRHPEVPVIGGEPAEPLLRLLVAARQRRLRRDEDLQEHREAS